MKVPGPPPIDLSAGQRAAAIEKWRTLVMGAYPEQTARFLAENPDPFRNPVGRALREGLPALFDELAGGMDWSRILPVLEEIIRIRAVQDFRASEAVGFLLLLKQAIREELATGDPAVAALDRRIDEMELRAFDLYTECREAIQKIQVNEARRRVFLVERAAAARQ